MVSGVCPLRADGVLETQLPRMPARAAARNEAVPQRSPSH